MKYFYTLLWGLIFFAVLTIGSQPAKAQIVNVQKLLLEDANGLFVSLGARLEWKSGNTDYLSVGGNSLVRWNIDEHTLLLSTRAKYSRTGDDAFVRSVFEHFRYMYQILDLLGSELFVQHEYNEATRLKVRALAGAGPRLTLRGEHFSFFAGSSYMLEYLLYTEESGTGDSGDEHLYHRWSNYITLAVKLNSLLELLHTTYVQPRFDEFSDVRALLESSFVIYINEHLHISINHTYTYNSRPAEGVKTYDSSLTVGIGLQWGPFFVKKEEN